MLTQGDIHDLFQTSAEDPCVGEAGYMLGLGFDQQKIRENLELRYSDPSLYNQFVDELERTLGVEVANPGSTDTMHFYDGEGDTVRLYSVSVEGTDDGFKSELKRAYLETTALRSPETPAELVRGLPERQRILLSIIRQKASNESSDKVSQSFVWDVYELASGESFTRNAVRFFTQQLAANGLIFQDGSDIYPEPLLTESPEIADALPDIGVTGDDRTTRTGR